jgi:hypothetical protein
LADSDFEHIRQHVKQATVFYSHVQSASPLSTLAHVDAVRLPELDGLPYWWIDYFSLRQCVNDFKPTQVDALVGQIGLLVAEIDSSLLYLRRSFCILELYAALSGDAQIYCEFDIGTASNIESMLTAQPLRAKDASTRRPKDKELIDEFIRENLGDEEFGIDPFQEFDECITDAMLEDAAVQKERFIDGLYGADGFMTQ